MNNRIFNTSPFRLLPKPISGLLETYLNMSTAHAWKSVMDKETKALLIHKVAVNHVHTYITHDARLAETLFTQVWPSPKVK